MGHFKHDDYPEEDQQSYDGSDQLNESHQASDYGNDSDQEEDNQEEKLTNQGQDDDFKIKQKQELESEEEDKNQNFPLIDFISAKKKQEIQLYDNFDTEQKQPNKIRITIPYITKYEKALIIGKRAQQISKNSPIYVILSYQQMRKMTAFDIAEKQYELGKIPLIIRRFLPDKTFEDWKLSQLKKLQF